MGGQSAVFGLFRFSEQEFEVAEDMRLDERMSRFAAVLHGYELKFDLNESRMVLIGFSAERASKKSEFRQWAIMVAVDFSHPSTVAINVSDFGVVPNHKRAKALEAINSLNVSEWWGGLSIDPMCVRRA